MIHRTLRLTREFHRMKQVDLARRLGISQSYLSEIEKGAKPPSMEIIQGFSSVFRIPASTFFMMEENDGTKASKERKDRAKRLLDFFEWILQEEDDGKTKKSVQARDTKKAVLS